MKKVTTIALFAFFAAQGCKKCADCSGIWVNSVDKNGNYMTVDFEHCAVKPYDVIGDTIMVEKKLQFANGTHTSHYKTYVTDCN